MGGSFTEWGGDRRPDRTETSTTPLDSDEVKNELRKQLQVSCEEYVNNRWNVTRCSDVLPVRRDSGSWSVAARPAVG